MNRRKFLKLSAAASITPFVLSHRAEANRESR